MNISSIVVQTQPKDMEEVIQELKKMKGVDFHFNDEFGRVIVTIEAPNVSDEVAILRKIEKINHVISAEMSYSYAEEELDAERANIGKQDDEILKILDDGNADLVYSGSVYSHLGKKEKKE